MIVCYLKERQPKMRFRVHLVQPVGQFKPTNWRNQPNAFRVLSSTDHQLRGSADSHKFLANQHILANGLFGQRWAIVEAI